MWYKGQNYILIFKYRAKDTDGVFLAQISTI